MTNKSLAFEGRPDPAGSSEMPAASTFAIHDRAMAHKPDMEMVLRREIERLRAAMLATSDQLHTLSMATEGHLRNRICTASNRLDAALGRQQSLHGEKF